MVRGTNIANSVQPGLCVPGAGRLRARRVEGWHVGATTSRSDNIPHACPLQRKASSLSEPAVMRQRQATLKAPTKHHHSPPRPRAAPQFAGTKLAVCHPIMNGQ